jgi:hypothetical protein
MDETKKRIEYKYYITLAPDGTVLKSFSTAFEEPTETDTLVGAGEGRHYNLDLYDYKKDYKLIYKDGKITEK